MYINSYNYNKNCDDWGWYIDIEDSIDNYESHMALNINKCRKTKNLSIYLNKLDKIEEENDEEFYYYTKNSREPNIYDCFKVSSNNENTEILVEKKR